MATPTTLPASFVDGNVLNASELNDLRGAFRVLQVVQSTKTDVFSGTSGTNGAPIAVTGLSASITPSATSSKILVAVQIVVNTGGSGYVTLRRNSTAITAATGNAVGSAQRCTTIGPGTDTSTHVIYYLDSPATTSSTSYDLTVGNSGTGFGIRVNEATAGTAATDGKGMSSITLLEISA